MDDLIQEFLTETQEGLTELDADIVNLEQNPNDADLIGKIFRIVHTIKGTCGFLGLPRLEKLAHHGENVLGRFRDGDLKVTPEYVTLILESFDRIKLIINGIEETGQEPDGDDLDLIEKLDVVYESTCGSVEPEKGKPNVADVSEIEGKSPKDMTTDDLDALFDADNAKRRAEKPEPAVDPTPTTAPATDNNLEKKQTANDDKKASSSASLRVNVQVLEDLMTTVSELVLTRNQLLQILRSQVDSEFSAPLQRLNQVVSELQEGVMQTRMQPIGNAWGKLPRIVRDISVELNKKINLDMRGQDTELDRQVLDLIKDPLTHMVRNSGDHGIELPEERVKSGKPEQGTISLNAYHEGGHIIIEISDDGKGLNLDRIKEKVLANGLATAEELEEMPDQRIQQFIFHAGFSTAEKVTSVSGRGVGMDVVRTNIEKIGGTIDLKTVEGKGSTFTIKIPLTLAIVSALIVEVSGQRYAMPQISVQELVRTSKNSDHRIENIKGTPVLRLRDRLLPLVNLGSLLNVSDVGVQIEESSGDDIENADAEVQESADDNYIIVTQVGAYTFGIIVDKVFDTEEIVVKPVSLILRHIEMFAGNTILGDGSVIMILDPNGIASVMGELSVSEQDDLDKAMLEDNGGELDRKISLLVFKAGEGAPKAVPLSLIARLENIDVSKIEKSSQTFVVQYRGQLMPLIPFQDNMNLKDTGSQAVLVFADQQNTMGLLVDEIIDIVEEHMDVQLGSENKGLLGGAVIKGTATDVIDVGYYLGRAKKDWFHASQTSYMDGKQGDRRRVLVVDDSPFFRNMLGPMLKVAGYNVVSADGPGQAVDLCEKGEFFDLIISDIEMPDMNGYDFAQIVKSEDSPWRDTPIMALSSHASANDIDRGLKSGFDEYVAKFDRDTLMDKISKTLSLNEEVA